jgi:hypothetical protein
LKDKNHGCNTDRYRQESPEYPWAIANHMLNTTHSRGPRVDTNP